MNDEWIITWDAKIKNWRQRNKEKEKRKQEDSNHKYVRLANSLDNKRII